MAEQRFPVDNILPGPGIDGATEFVWVAGHAFVNAAKHEQVVDHHVARADAAEARAERLQGALSDFVEAEAATRTIETPLELRNAAVIARAALDQATQGEE